MMKDDEFFREIQSNCWDAETRIQECKHTKVDVQVLSTIPIMFNYWAKPEHCYDISRFLNDHIAEITERYPKKFIGLGTVPMQNSDLAIKELERCKKIGLVGIEIGSNINDINLNEPQFFPIYKAAQELDLAIFVHPWNMMGTKQMSKYWLPWLVGMPAEISRAICSMIFGGIFEKYPNLKVCFAHGGGSFLPTISRIEHGWDCRPDLVAIDNEFNPKKYLGKFWVDSHVCDHKMLQYIVDLVGADKVVQGSDYPFPLGEAVPGTLVREAPLSDTEKTIIMGTAAKAWLSL